MLKNERQAALLELCAENGSVSVRQIVNALGVSEMTVRRDFDELAKTGKVARVHGGIRALSHAAAPAYSERSYSDKLSLHVPQKRAIGQAAAQLIEEYDTIFLGPGSTCNAVAACLPPVNLRVVTNSLLVFNTLAQEDNVELCMIGGCHRQRSASIVGPIAEEMMSTLGIDKCFIGANGVMGSVASTSNIEEGRLQSLAFARSAARYLVVDSTKIGQMDFYNFYNLDRLDALITDEDAAQDQIDAIGERTHVIIAR